MLRVLPNHLILSENFFQDLKLVLKSLSPDKVVVLVDENTEKYCLEKAMLHDYPTIKIASGESNKNITTTVYIWKCLTGLRCTRNSLLINLGGGVIGDMGGFAAATYKRGMRFINIPTTLLAQVDASIGGKLGIDFHGLKNHIGLFKDPNFVIISTEFLATLPKRHLRSGFAEVIKHALIYDKSQWDYLKKKDIKTIHWQDIIKQSIAIKCKIVHQDPFEQGIRKILNFGHTLGHALESYFLTTSKTLLHGEAVAIGMILETFISIELGLLNKSIGEELITSILNWYDDLPNTLPDISNQNLYPFLVQDKKNQDNEIRFALLKAIGNCQYDITVSESIMQNAIKAFMAINPD